MHGSYRRAFGPESVVELHKNIIIQHEDFLKQDDADKKADSLRYMAGYVVQYLHLVPQEKKFTFQETERLLNNSAMNIAEFDPREGSIAFCNLAKYAENLLEQPWRKDFHVIKLTSGFYVHNIAAQLQNAHEILIVMGYVNTDDTTLKLIPNQNYANLKAVSRDCYVASQECLILSQIWQHVADQEPDYPLTIGEVFEYRKNHLGDTDTICNKLLYDIRARMYALKQHQQMQLHQPQSHIKNTQRFVPVDKLIDYDADPPPPGTDEPDRPHHPHHFIPEREVDQVQDHLRNVNLYSYNQDDEHIYDPVYGGDIPSVPNHAYQRKLSHPQQAPPPQVQQQKPNNVIPSQYLYNNNARKSVASSNPSYYPPQQQQQQYHHNNFNSNSSNNMIMYGASDRNSVSPMIPKTVTSFFSNNQSGSRNNVSKSNSMNSISGVGGGASLGGRGANSSSSSSSMSHNYATQPLTKSKIRETDLDAEMGPPSYYNPNDNRNMRTTRKSMPASMSMTPNNHSINPDQYYPPGIVKPVAVYGSSSALNPPVMASQQQLPSYFPVPRTRLHSDNSEDVLNEAYAYASEVGQLPKGQQPPRQGPLSPLQGQGQHQIYQHQATPIPPIHGSDSESDKSRNASVQRELQNHHQEQRISNTARSGSSTDASSSWEGSVREAGGRHNHQQQQNVTRIQVRKEPPKRPSHIDLRATQIRHADSSPESDLVHHHQPPTNQQSRNKNGYRELSSSSGSSGNSPASTSSRNYPRNEDLSSLDTVYYDYLLKQGQTDQVLGTGGVGLGGGESKLSKSHINHGNNEQEAVQHVNSHRRTSSSGRSSSSHHHQNQQNNYGGNEGTEENHIYDGRRVVPKKHNDTVNRKRQNPVESTIPGVSPNYNLLSSNTDKPSHLDKHLKKSSNHSKSRSGSDRVPEESEDPSVSGSVSPPPQSKVPVEPWDCRFCTFRNTVEERICEICAKSKDFYEELEAPAPAVGGAQTSSASQPTREQVVIPKMYSVPTSYASAVTNGGRGGVGGGASGGGGGGTITIGEQEEERECPQCTLLNPIRARVCDACNFRLKPVESPKHVLMEETPYDNR